MYYWNLNATTWTLKNLLHDKGEHLLFIGSAAKKRHTSIGDAYNCCLKHLKKFVAIYLREGKSL